MLKRDYANSMFSFSEVISTKYILEHTAACSNNLSISAFEGLSFRLELVKGDVFKVEGGEDNEIVDTVKTKRQSPEFVRDEYV